MELVGENFLSYISCIRNLVRVSVSAKSRKIVCRFHEDFIDPVVNWHEHFWTVSYVQMFRWSHGNTVALKKGEPLPKLILNGS